MSFTRTLILNQTYRPHEVVDWKDAVTRMFKGTIEILVQYDEILAHLDRQTLHTFPELRRALRQVIGTDAESLDIKVPAVGVLRRRVSHVKGGIKFSKINVCLRDDFRCQYCGVRLAMSKLNYDHVIPRSLGGKTVWENIVMACYPCNDKKGSLSVGAAGMHLLSVPTKPKVLPMNEPIIDVDQAPEEWAPFLGGTHAA
jgi:5-methylcytosine-specific restriction endonuclease McrA